MNCDRCKKEIVAKIDKFVFAERTVCANCFDALWEEAGEAEMREEAECADLERNPNSKRAGSNPGEYRIED